MNILYLPCHSTLEYDEVKLFTDMGHSVFSMHGAYFNPTTPSDPKRPAIDASIQQQLMDVAAQCTKDDLHQELIDWADIIYVMHLDQWITNNWKKIKNKHVIWRTIGQSVPQIESRLALSRVEGLKIVRYSPREESIMGYLGADAVIRFYKDENEFCGWNGDINEVITVAQSMKRRGEHCGYDVFNNATSRFPRKIFGPQNEDSGCDGGQLSYDELKDVYRNHRAYFYTGTYPASYTLNFIEAFMTGIPIVAIGNDIANLADYKLDGYEVHKIIENGVNGFWSDDIKELGDYVEKLLGDKDLAKEIGDKGRQTAISLFGKETIKQQWEDFFKTL